MNDTTRQQIIELLTTPPNNGDTHTMEFISDSSHGWLKVPVSAYQLANAPASRFSYTDSDNVYLEEDSDAPRFLKAVGIVNRDSGLELDGERWYIPERNLVNQRRYNEVSPRDMASLNDPAYSSPFETGKREANLGFGRTYDGDPESTNSREYDNGRTAGETVTTTHVNDHITIVGIS